MTRRAFDFYPTPPAAVKSLGAWIARRGHALDGRWFDPCVGAGAIPLWLQPYLDPSASWAAADIQQQMADQSRSFAPHLGSVVVRDGIGPDPWREVHEGQTTAVVMNPPYGSECERWIDRALKEVRASVAGTYLPVPYVFALTRVSFWADGARVRSLRPDRLLWLEKRLSFTGDGRTDNSAHCWAVWHFMPRGPRPPGETVVETLPLVPVSADDTHTHQAMLGRAHGRQEALDFTSGVSGHVPENDGQDVGEGVHL